jgi:hypothetical protein
MSSPFVWFHHNGQKSKETKSFFESLFTWKGSEGPAGMTMLVEESAPFAALGSKQERYGDRDEWELGSARFVDFAAAHCGRIAPIHQWLVVLSA